MERSDTGIKENIVQPCINLQINDELGIDEIKI